jgi:hypothetical protein
MMVMMVAVLVVLVVMNRVIEPTRGNPTAEKTA